MTHQVLVVDDSITLRRHVAALLAGAGYGVVEAADGEAALACLAADPSVELVVSDINMPKMSGLDLIQHMAEDATLAAIPVVVLTTSGDPYSSARAKGNGVRAWIQKPVQAEQLLAIVTRLLAPPVAGEIH